MEMRMRFLFLYGIVLLSIRKVLDTPKVSLYLKNTTPYNVPKMNLSILVNSIYSMNTPKNYIKTTLLLKYFS